MKDFFTKTVANIPVWSFFLIGLAVILIFAVTAIMISKKKRNATATSCDTEVPTTEKSETADNVVVQAEKAEDIKPSIEETLEVETVVDEPVVEEIPAETVEEIKAEPVVEEVKQDTSSAEVVADIAIEKKTTKKTTTKTSATSTKTTSTSAASKTKTTPKAKAGIDKIEKVETSEKVEKTEKPAAKATAKTAAAPKTTEKPASAAKAPTKKVQKIETDDESKSSGKFQIIFDKNNEIKPYKFCLVANNGKVLFESESYKVKPTMRSINAFKRHCKEGTFFIDEDKNNNYRYKLYNSADALVGVGEGYSSKTICENAIESVKKFSASANSLEDLTTELF